nr:uncharacterized protein LOC118879064 [Drosophila suzukii]
MLSRLIDRLDIIAGKVKEINARVLTLEREVADLHSMRDRMGEQVETLNREVENLQAAGERLGALEARLATQFRETSSCNLRVHGVPYVDGKDLRALYHNLCFNLQLTPPPEVCDIFRARKSQKTHVDPVTIIKMLNPRECTGASIYIYIYSYIAYIDRIGQLTTGHYLMLFQTFRWSTPTSYWQAILTATYCQKAISWITLNP